MAKLTITRGYPGSGKTTWATGQAGNVRVNRDDLRSALFHKSGVLPAAEEAQVTIAQRAQVTALLDAGINVIVDDTNLNLRHARAFADLAKKHGADFECRDFPATASECIERNLTRLFRGERFVESDVILKMARRYPISQWQRVTAHEWAQDNWTPWQPNHELPYAILTDIDGTLADHEGLRSPYDFSKVGADRPIRHAIDAVQAMATYWKAPIIALSGRDDSCYAATMTWLNSQGINPSALYMRKTGDKRRDSIVKHEIFHDQIAPFYNPLAVFDDRAQVVRMWWAIGLPLLRVGDPDADF